MSKVTLMGQEIEVSTIEAVEVDGSILRLKTVDGELEFFHKDQELSELNKVEIEKLMEVEMDKSKEIIELFAREKSQSFEAFQYKDENGKYVLLQVSPEEKKQLEKKEISIKEIQERRNKEKW